MSRIFTALQEAQRRAGLGSRAAWEESGDQQESRAPSELPKAHCGEAGVLTLSPRENDRLVSLTDPQDVGGESFRLLVSRLSYMRKTRDLRSILITSSVMNEGKSVVAANLAIAMANHGGQRVLLIDGDHRHASLTRLFRCYGKPGLREWLVARGSAASFAQRMSDRGLWFVPSGTGGPDPERNSQASRISELLAGTENFFDWILVDSSPATLLADTTLWSSVLDGCLLVVRQGFTPKKMLQKSLEALDPAKLIGVLLNDCTDPSHAYHSLYYRNKKEDK